MAFRFRSTRVFLAILVGLMAVPSLGISFFFAYRHYQHELDTIARTARHVADAVSMRERRIVRESEVLLRQIVQYPQFSLENVDQCNQYAAQLKATLPEHSNVGLATINGDILCSALPLKQPVNIRDRAYFKRALATGNFEGGEYLIGRISGRATSNYGLAIYDTSTGTPTPKAVAFITIDVLKLNQILIDAMPENGTVLTLLSGDGDIVTRYPDPEGFTGKKFPDSELVKNLASHHNKGGVFEGKGLDGVLRMYAYSLVRGTGEGSWYMVVGVPVKEATAEFRRLLTDQFIIILLAFGSLLVIGMSATERFSRRLRAVTHVAEKIRQGDYGARSGLPTRNDEIGQLALAFDEMAVELGQRDQEQKRSLALIQQMNEGLEARVAQRTQELDNAAARLESMNANLKQSLQEREAQSSQLKKLAELSDLLQSCLTLDEAYQLIARYCEVLGKSPAGAIYLMRSSRNRVERIAAWGSTSEFSEECMPQDCWALRRGSVHRTAPDDAQPFCAHNHEGKNKHTMCVPIIAQGETIGFIHTHLAQEAQEEFAYALMLDLLVTIAEQGGQTIAALKLREELQRQSIRDPLTGLYNRRYMEETLAREQNRVVRNGSALSVISFDIDHFKNVNDTYGHDAGDCALKLVANVLKDNVRAEDIVCRLGGEEIVVVLPGAGMEKASERAQELRRLIQQQPMEYSDKQLPAITVSGGVATFPIDAATWQDILKVADQRLYQAKRAGRNRIVSAEQHAVLSPAVGNLIPVAPDE